jgi:hypothetical protein
LFKKPKLQSSKNNASNNNNYLGVPAVLKGAKASLRSQSPFLYCCQVMRATSVANSSPSRGLGGKIHDSEKTEKTLGYVWRQGESNVTLCIIKN